MEPIAADAIATRLKALDGWALADDGTAIHRTLKFADFTAAFGFMTAVALEAQAADHHPDWSNSWATVDITLSTHAAGGLTARDFDLAELIDAHAARLLADA